MAKTGVGGGFIPHVGVVLYPRPPVDRMYVTAKPGVTTLVMAENHTKTQSSVVQCQP